jgi:4-hydroxy-tetrahydrodipicolinate reductase|tara:strand:+ start:2406 stop:3206 length:801 start_codon:yes stop_codon:yes gene_type:complete
MTTPIPPEKETKFILVGATGKLGRSISSHNAYVTYGICSKDNPLLGEVISGIKEPLISSLSEVNLEIANIPLVIDASYPENFDNVYDFCYKNKIPLVLASTGHTQEQLKKLDKLAKKVSVLKAPNLSEGIAFFKKMIIKPIIHLINSQAITKTSIPSDYDISDVKIKIIETHHDKKKDAPSGTAIDLKNYIKKGLGHLDSEIEIESIRDKSSVGKHEVIFRLKNEEFSFSHNALNRDIFGLGISLARDILKKEPGIYSMTELLEDR